MALCLIEAHNVWAQLVRYFFVSCMLGATTARGNKVRQSVGVFATEHEAIAYAVKVLPGAPGLGGPLSEPPWYKASTLTTLATAAGLSNIVQIGLAMSVVGEGIEDLTKARNFFAHRSRHSAGVLRSVRKKYGVARTVRAGLLPAQQHPSVPGTIAREWVSELVRRTVLLPQ